MNKKDKKYKPIQRNLEGIISINSKGVGYVNTTGEKNKNKGDDIEIDFKHLNTALHGDKVSISLYPKGQGRLSGEVIDILSRAKNSFVGVLEEENKIFFLKPDDTKMYTDILISPNELHGAKAGQKIYVEIISWKDHRKMPEGKVLKINGDQMNEYAFRSLE